MSKGKRKFDYNVKNKHHILWQAKNYSNGYAKRLREHPYMAKMIPRDTLHSEIHTKIADIPCPSGNLCKRAYLELIRLEENEGLNFDSTIEERIDFLLELWDFDSCPRTVVALLYQKEIVHNFYKGG